MSYVAVEQSSQSFLNSPISKDIGNNTAVIIPLDNRYIRLPTEHRKGAHTTLAASLGGRYDLTGNQYVLV